MGLYPSASTWPLRLRLYCLLIVAVSSSVADNPTNTPPQLCDSVPDKPACVSVCGSSSTAIDLTMLFKNDSAGPLFTGVIDPDGDATYLYNPCYPFDFKDCKNVQVCSVGVLVESIGDGGTEKMMIDPNGIPYLRYTAPTLLDPTSIKSQVYLYCTHNPDPVITYMGTNNPDLVYTFNLSTCHACPGGCSSKKTQFIPVGYVGAAVIFVMMCALVGYCVVGAILVRIRKESEGVLPNQKFWTSSLSLVKDGCLFTCSPVVHLVSRKINRKSYETIQGKDQLRYT